MDIDTHDLETKAGLPADPFGTYGEMQRMFEQFKQANEERLSSAKRGGDVLPEEKVARINDVLGAHHVSSKASR